MPTIFNCEPMTILDTTENRRIHFTKTSKNRPQHRSDFRYKYIRRYRKYFLLQAAVLNFRVKESSKKVGVGTIGKFIAENVGTAVVILFLGDTESEIPELNFQHVKNL